MCHISVLSLCMMESDVAGALLLLCHAPELERLDLRRVANVIGVSSPLRFRHVSSDALLW